MSDPLDTSHTHCWSGRRPLHRLAQEGKVTFLLLLFPPVPRKSLIPHFQDYARLIIPASRCSLHLRFPRRLPRWFLHPNNLPLHRPHRLCLSSGRLVLLPLPHLHRISQRSNRKFHLGNHILLLIKFRHLLNVQPLVRRIPLHPPPENQ